jgi:hypothetical protein
MKLKHNKKRNTAFIYEVLINELSKADMQGMHERKQKIINTLKSFFSKGAPLKEELRIYNSLSDLVDVEKNIVEKIILEAKSQSAALNREQVYLQQTRVINLINKELGLDVWNGFVREYKKIATINQTIFSKANPKKQVFLEQKLVQILTQPPTVKKAFPSINKLALKSFVEKFNKEYSQTLNESQKTLLNKYITSYKDSGLELKMFLYEEIDRLKEELRKHSSDGEEPGRISLVLEKVENYTNRKIDKKLLVEVIKIQSLVEEISHAAKN